MQELIDLINEYRVVVSTKERELALEALFEHLNPKIYLYFLGYVSDQEAQDLRSITLLEIHKGIKNFRGNTSQSAWEWCYTIAWRKLAVHFKEKKGSSFIERKEPDLLEELIAASTFESEADRIDVHDALSMLKKSDPNCSQVLWDHFISGLAYGELSEKMGKTVDAVRMQISRCLEKIEPLLS